MTPKHIWVNYNDWTLFSRSLESWLMFGKSSTVMAARFRWAWNLIIYPDHGYIFLGIYLLGDKLLTYHAWWFQTFFIFHNILYGIPLPIDELMFFKMVIAPPTSIMGIEYISGCKIWLNILCDLARVDWDWVGVTIPKWPNISGWWCFIILSPKIWWRWNGSKSPFLGDERTHRSQLVWSHKVPGFWSISIPI